MTPTELLKQLGALDAQVAVEDGRLRVNAPNGRITPELEAALRANKEELLKQLETAHPPALTALTRSGAALPLSFFQERLWVLDRLQPGTSTYNFGSLFRPQDADA